MSTKGQRMEPVEEFDGSAGLRRAGLARDPVEGGQITYTVKAQHSRTNTMALQPLEHVPLAATVDAE